MNEILEREKSELSSYDFNKLIYNMYKRGDISLEEYMQYSYDE